MTTEHLQMDAEDSWSPERVKLIKATVARNATDDELRMFLYLCRVYGLDPFRRELVFQKRRGQEGDTVTFITSRDGYLKAAMRDPNYAGLQSMPVREGDHFEVNPAEGCVTHRFGAKRGGLLGAWAVAYHKTRPPVIGWADFEEYFKACSGSSPVWRSYPSAMIQKIAEVAALRRQFNLSGIVTREELSTDPEPSALPDRRKVPPLEVTGRPGRPALPAGEVVDAETRPVAAEPDHEAPALSVAPSGEPPAATGSQRNGEVTCSGCAAGGRRVPVPAYIAVADGHGGWLCPRHAPQAETPAATAPIAAAPTASAEQTIRTPDPEPHLEPEPAPLKEVLIQYRTLAGRCRDEGIPERDIQELSGRVTRAQLEPEVARLTALLGAL